jgi:hypothetical protein
VLRSLALFLALALSISAEVRVGAPRVVHTLDIRPANADSLAIAAGGGTRLVIWSEGKDMFVARAGSDWTLIANTREQLPHLTREPLLQSLQPSVAWSGSMFLIVWTERRSYAMGSDKLERVAVRYDPATGVVEREPLFLGWTAGPAVPQQPVWDGRNFVLAGDFDTRTISTAGVLSPARRLFLFQVASTGRPNEPLFVSKQPQFACTDVSCTRSEGVAPMLIDDYVEFPQPGTVTATSTIITNAAAAAGDDGYVIAMRDGAAIVTAGYDRLLTRRGVTRQITRYPDNTTPRLAYDGRQFLLIWSDSDAAGRPTVNASTINTRGELAPELVEIGAGAVSPSLAELAPGRYAVAYLSTAGSQVQIVVRPVDTIAPPPPSRTRASR